MAPIELHSRARLAYELGRLRAAAPLALPALLVAAAALFIGRPPALVASVCAGLAVLSVALVFARSHHRPAVRLGLLAGVAPLVLPFAVRSFGHLCTGGACMELCLPTCLVAGLLAGLLVGFRAADAAAGRLSFGLVAALIAGLAGALGCTLVGSAGVLGMIAGLALGSAPLLLREQLSRG